MKTVNEIKDQIPKNILGKIETDVEMVTKDYALTELGEDRYIELKNDESGETNDLDALELDFEKGFWYAVEYFGIQFNEK